MIGEVDLLQLRHEPVHQRRERVKRHVLNDRLGFEQRSIDGTWNQRDRGCGFGLYPCGVQEIIEQAVQRQDTRLATIDEVERGLGPGAGGAR